MIASTFSRLPLTTPVLADFRFATDWPVWLVLTISMAVGLLILVLYLRESRELGSPWAWILPGLRATAVVLACLLLAGPVWHHRYIVGSPAKVVWAIDRSQSMGESDSQAAPNRLRRASDLLFGVDEHEGWIDRLASSHWMDVVLFDDSSQTIWDSGFQSATQTATTDRRSQDGEDVPIGVALDAEAQAKLELATGSSTDLASPLRMASDQTKSLSGSDTAAASNSPPVSDGMAAKVLVLFSDGRDTVGRNDASEMAADLARLGWQIHAVGMGSVDESPDLGIVDVDAPQRVADDGRLAGNVRIKHVGFEGRQAIVEVRAGDAVVWSKTIRFAESSEGPIQSEGPMTVAFEFPVETLMQKATAEDLRGVDRDSVVLSLKATVRLSGDGEPGDVSVETDASGEKTDNDSFDFRVAAASRDRQLLILDGSSRWEIRYLRNLFARDPAWQVDTVLFGPGTDQSRVVRGEEAGQLPASPRAWARYDAVVLGEIPPQQWTRQDADGLAEFVRRGGGLILLDGRYDRIAELSRPAVGESGANQDDSTMAGLIPVRFGDEEVAGSVDSASETQSTEVDFIEPTDRGRVQPVMSLDSTLSDTGVIWSRLPPPASVRKVSPQADAEVWADAVDKSGKRTAWLVTRLYGAGRVFYLASDQTWRWRYKVEGQLHGRFWNQLLTAAMQPPYAVRDEFVAIGTDKIDYEIGQSATIRAALLQAAAGESRFAADEPALAERDSEAETLATTVDALLLKDDQIVATLPMRLEDAGRRTYVARTAGLPAGEYRVRVRASGYDASALKASTPIWVVPKRSSELDRVSVDQVALRRMTSSGGGMYVHESSADEILAQIAPLSRGRIVESDTLLWQTWWVFCLIILLLVVEWWFRKKVGLA